MVQKFHQNGTPGVIPNSAVNSINQIALGKIFTSLIKYSNKVRSVEKDTKVYSKYYVVKRSEIITFLPAHYCVAHDCSKQF